MCTLLHARFFFFFCVHVHLSVQCVLSCSELTLNTSEIRVCSDSLLIMWAGYKNVIKSFRFYWFT